jgi:hypothetical protein
MTNAKKLGIWMDHSRAHLMEFTSTPIQTKIIKSDFTHEDKERTLGSGENQMHKREQHQQAEYYKKLGEAIRHYEEVIIFGPTDAKVELLNKLSKDHHFASIKIKIQDADKMTENQQHAFVKKYFSGK